MPRELVANYEINIKVSSDFDGFYKYNGEEISVDDKISFSCEYINFFSDYVGAGAAITAQLPRTIDDIDGKFGFVPVYVLIKVRSWPQQPGMCGYVCGQFGYGFFYCDSEFKKTFSNMKGGVYYAAGFGLEYKKFLIEFLYGINKAEIKKPSEYKSDIEYGKLTFSFGIKL